MKVYFREEKRKRDGIAASTANNAVYGPKRTRSHLGGVDRALNRGFVAAEVVEAQAARAGNV